MIKLVSIVVLILSINVNAQVFYKCEKNGMTIFSQQPCGEKAEEVKAKDNSERKSPRKKTGPADSNVISKNPKSDMLKVKIYNIDQKIKRHNKKINSAKRKMTKEITILKHRATYANNNLAGAIYQDALSEEMVAISNKYTAIINDEERLIDELKELQNSLRQQLN